jgi:hypothetical protein
VLCAVDEIAVCEKGLMRFTVDSQGRTGFNIRMKQGAISINTEGRYYPTYHCAEL